MYSVRRRSYDPRKDSKYRNVIFPLEYKIWSERLICFKRDTVDNVASRNKPAVVYSEFYFLR